jgi:hypothetical protein
MKLTPRAQATLRNLIICRQTQLDQRLASAGGSARKILSDEHTDIIKLWDEIEALEGANVDWSTELPTEKPSHAGPSPDSPPRRKAGRPKKKKEAEE